MAPLNARIGNLENVRCAVIGAGGAARAAIWALRDHKASVTVFGRDRDKAKLLGDQFEIEMADLTKSDFSAFDVVINATPLGTRGKDEAETVATADQLRGVRLAYDLVYNPLETRFMREARDAGCQTVGGLEMLIGQAVEQFKLWTGREPNVEVMRVAAAKALR
jgi:shikimate dehydrogenase